MELFEYSSRPCQYKQLVCFRNKSFTKVNLVQHQRVSCSSNDSLTEAVRSGKITFDHTERQHRLMLCYRQSSQLYLTHAFLLCGNLFI